MHRIEGENVDVSSGVNLFKDTPPYTVATPAWMNAVQEEIMNVISNAGLPELDENADAGYRNQLWTAIQNMVQGWDYIVHSQTTFNDLFERTGANAYQIKSDYENVLFKQATGGYSVNGILSGGDTWGDISTNACKHIEFQNGAYINFAALPGNLTINTDDCYLKNVNIQGNGSSGAIVDSFELGANRVTFDNCKCSNRLSSVDMAGFQGSGTALHNVTSKYINCSAYALDGADKVYGFKDCYNLQNCLAYDLDSTSGADAAYAFSDCNNLNSCYAYQIDGGNAAVGFYQSNQISNSVAEDLDAPSSYGFFDCDQVSSCKAYDINATSGNADGFYQCNQISSCIAQTIDATGGSYGFQDCDQISSCYATDIDSSGAVAYGYHSCNYGAALYTSEVNNASNDWIDTVDAQITNKVSTPSVWT